MSFDGTPTVAMAEAIYEAADAGVAARTIAARGGFTVALVERTLRRRPGVDHPERGPLECWCGFVGANGTGFGCHQRAHG